MNKAKYKWDEPVFYPHQVFDSVLFDNVVEPDEHLNLRDWLNTIYSRFYVMSDIKFNLLIFASIVCYYLDWNFKVTNKEKSIIKKFMVELNELHNRRK